MSALSIAGVDLPVATDSLSLELEQVGSRARNTRGHSVLERRATKWVFNFETSPVPLDEAMLYRSLINGDGEFWGMAASAYGSKGLAVTGTGSYSGGVGNPYGGGSWGMTGGQTMVIPTKLYTQSVVGGLSTGYLGATLAGWRYDSGGAAWRCFAWGMRASVTAPTVKREKLGALGSSGVTQNYTGTETFSHTGGNLTVTAPAGTWYFSNLLLLPWFLPQTQLDQLLEGLATVRKQLPMLPRVLVQSDLFSPEQLVEAPYGSVQNSLICHGEVSDMRVVPLMRGGSLSTTDCVLSGSLTEV